MSLNPDMPYVYTNIGIDAVAFAFLSVVEAIMANEMPNATGYAMWPWLLKVKPLIMLPLASIPKSSIFS